MSKKSQYNIALMNWYSTTNIFEHLYLYPECQQINSLTLTFFLWFFCFFIFYIFIYLLFLFIYFNIFYLLFPIIFNICFYFLICFFYYTFLYLFNFFIIFLLFILLTMKPCPPHLKYNKLWQIFIWINSCPNDN